MSRRLKAPMVAALALVLAGGYVALWNRPWSKGCATIVVSKRDIAPGTVLNPLIAAGDFTTRCVGPGRLVDGAVVSIDELRDQTNSYTIYANEQIPTARIPN